jgi:hypothetical protein
LSSRLRGSGAAVVDQNRNSNQDLTPGIAYKVTNNNQGYFNFGGSIGYYVSPGDFPPDRSAAGEEAFLTNSATQFLAANPATVTTYF